ncbi:PTS system fructose-specific transporter subunit IIA [Klebsiella pneumoniae]|uniref:protein-N(pi)-phosphohistidine--D-fructose phosphotransferase n=1 Tax=Klebsiella pneumoniae TaxID=573 RepID=A0A447RGT5_KLEPN|nr:PTS system fructose-specific transporter subunit IIA [Klebsiella pneumoniae]
MNIVGVTACTVGIAHTYIAQKKIETAAKKAGHNVKIETQGTIGIENSLTADGDCRRQILSCLLPMSK